MTSGSLPGHLAWIAGTHHLRLGLATRVFRNDEGADSGVVRFSIRALGRHWPDFSKHSSASSPGRGTRHPDTRPVRRHQGAQLAVRRTAVERHLGEHGSRSHGGLADWPVPDTTAVAGGLCRRFRSGRKPTDWFVTIFSHVLPVTIFSQTKSVTISSQGQDVTQGGEGGGCHDR